MKKLAETLLPLVRAWIRYSPFSFGKVWLATQAARVHNDFACGTRLGFRVRGNTRDLIQRYLYLFGIWEPAVTRALQQRLQPGDLFVDVGANIGYYSLLASRLVGPTGRVLAIEASPATHQLLRQHLQENGATNVRTIQAAVAESAGTLQLYPGPASNIGRTSTIPNGQPSVDVQAAPLPTLLAEADLARLSVIKIDVEGAELGVVRGLVPLLPHLPQRTEILMEVSARQMPTGMAAVEEIFRVMHSHGFRAFRIRNDYSPAFYLGAVDTELAPVDAGADLQLADLLFSRRQAVAAAAP